MVLSTDRENPTDVLAMTGASAALHLSDLPWAGPFAGVRVGRIGGEFIVNPTFAQRQASELDLTVAASRDAIVMVEGGAQHVSEEVLVDALMFAHKAAQPLIDLQEKTAGRGGQAQACFPGAGRGSGAGRARARVGPAQDRGRHGHPRESWSAMRHWMRWGAKSWK